MIYLLFHLQAPKTAFQKSTPISWELGGLASWSSVFSQAWRLRPFSSSNRTCNELSARKIRTLLLRRKRWRSRTCLGWRRNWRPSASPLQTQKSCSTTWTTRRKQSRVRSQHLEQRTFPNDQPIGFSQNSEAQIFFNKLFSNNFIVSSEGKEERVFEKILQEEMFFFLMFNCYKATLLL